MSAIQVKEMVRRAARESVQEALIQNGNEPAAPPPPDSSSTDRK
jgi:hypothetical protein